MTREGTDPEANMGKEIPRGGFAVLAALIVAVAASRLWLLPVHYSVNPNEGWNGYQAAQAMGAGPLYPPSGGLTGNNYPPLSFYVVGFMGKAIGDMIIAGRLLALASVAAVAGNIGLITRRVAGSGTGAAPIAILIFLALNATVLRRYLALDDPQWFAQALMATGIMFLIPSEAAASPKPLSVVGAAALVMLGALTKHNLVAWPMAATLWLAIHHRRALVVWLATGIGIAVLAALLCTLTFGANFFADVLDSPRSYSLVRMLDRAAAPTLVMVAMLALCRPLWRAKRSDSRIDLILLAIAIAVPIGIVQRSGYGVNINAHFEALVALCIGVGVALCYPISQLGKLRALGVLLLILFGFGAVSEAREMQAYRADAASWRAIDARVRAVDGNVACESVALCYWAGEPFVLDFFLYGEKIRLSGDPSQLAKALSARQIVAIELEPRRETLTGRTGGPLEAYVEHHMKPVYADAEGRRLLTTEFAVASSS